MLTWALWSCRCFCMVLRPAYEQHALPARSVSSVVNMLGGQQRPARSVAARASWCFRWDTGEAACAADAAQDEGGEHTTLNVSGHALALERA